LPNIQSSDYEAIRGLMQRGVLPGTYQEWLDLRASWLAEYANDTVIDVDVSVGRFKKYLAASGKSHALMSLLDFVAKEDGEQ
jgi:hypothetical protein